MYTLNDPNGEDALWRIIMTTFREYKATDKQMLGYTSYIGDYVEKYIRNNHEHEPWRYRSLVGVVDKVEVVVLTVDIDE